MAMDDEMKDKDPGMEADESRDRAGSLSGAEATAQGDGARDGLASGAAGGGDWAEAQVGAAYDRSIRMLEEAAAKVTPESDEQRRARERRERSRKIVSAVGDGVAALANLFFTSRYAPNMYKPELSQLGALNKRLEQERAARRENNEKYLNFVLKGAGMQAEKAKTLRELQAQQEKLRIAREAAEREAEKHKWEKDLQEDRRREQSGKADKVAAEAETARVEAGYAPRMQEAKLVSEKALGTQRVAAAGASSAAAEASRAAAQKSRSDAVKEYAARSADGSVTTYKNRQAAIDHERREGTYDPKRWGDDVVKETEVEETKPGKLTGTTQTSSKTTRTRTTYTGFDASQYKRKDDGKGGAGAPPLN